MELENLLIVVCQLQAVDCCLDLFARNYTAGGRLKNDLSEIFICFKVFRHLLDADWED